MKSKICNLFDAKHILLIFVLCFFIFIFKYIFLNIKEPLTNEDTIVLIGDSILNNSNYVSVGKSVADNVKLLHGNKVINLAKDGATIETCNHQLNSNQIMNDENYYLFVSIGGNDILNGNIKLENLKKKYVELIDVIKNKYSKTKIHLLNLYFPFDKKYDKYEKQIIEWNEMISLLCDENKYKLLRLDNLLINKSDIVYEIEPSAMGSEKIAKLIVSQ